VVPFALSEPLSEGLQELGRRSGATLYMVLLAGFQVLLSRWSGQKDIVVGSPIAGRTHRDTEGLIGFFVNTLAMRGDLSANPRFEELLAQVKRTTLEAYAHQDLPFEKLVEELQPVRDLSRQPICQVNFTFQNQPRESFELPDVRWSGLSGGHVTAKLDLTLFISETPSGLCGAIEYATDLFDRQTIQRLSGHFETLLGGIVADPEQRVAELPLLSVAERERLLVQWNATEAPYKWGRCLHELLAEQATRTPQAAALVFGDQQLSYGQLEERSNQLAHHLVSLGVGPDVIVGLCVERSLEMVVGLLGILKAGGAYLPLDPQYPAQRLAHMLQDAQVPVLLTHSGLLNQLPETSATRVCLDREWGWIAAQQWSAPPSVVGPQNLAYVIYTSGSTGMPKGAMVSHESIVNRLLWMDAVYGLEPSDRVLQKTSLSFDVSVWEVFWPLLKGAGLVMAEPEGHKDSDYLVALIAQSRISILHFVPSMLRAFLQNPKVSECGSLRDVVCSGEALTLDVVREFAGKLPARLQNLYGPTEAAVDVSFWQCEASAETVPIGRPISNTRLYVLDELLEPVPIGVIGELYIGGAGLARGYLRRPGLTAQRFIASPFGSGDRLYCTGDRVLYRSDGNLEFIGRRDTQIKIRGYRIELGEIEAALRSHAAVSQAVVVAREEEIGQRRLVGYVVSATGEDVEVASLREHLKKSLPEYMVPAVLVQLEQIPLTANGKIDRQALPAPEGRPEIARYVAPRTAVEATLAQIWREVLRLDQVGVEDNFFELGGHSLLAMRVLIQVRELLTSRMGLRDLFEFPKIEDLARRIEGFHWADKNQEMLPIDGLDSEVMEEGTV
jgi:amino acid adenylation domain-containing protein